MTLSKTTSSSIRLLSILAFIGIPASMMAATAVNLLQIAVNHQSIAENDAQAAALAGRLEARTNIEPNPIESAYIVGSSKTAAIAELQRIVVATISTASGRLIQTEAADNTNNTPASVDGDRGAAFPGTIRLVATLDIDNEGLLQLLYKLESRTPFIDIETLSVRTLPSEDGKLRVDLTTSARWKTGNSS